MRRYVRFGLITLMLLAATLGAGFMAFHMHLNRCHECGRIGPWKPIKALLEYRSCECGAIQQTTTYFGFETGLPCRFPPLRIGTSRHAEIIKKLILENGGRHERDSWTLDYSASRLRRQDIDSLIDLSKLSVQITPCSVVHLSCVRVAVDKHHTLDLHYEIMNDTLTSLHLQFHPEEADEVFLRSSHNRAWDNDFKWR